MHTIRWFSQPTFELIENENKSISLRCYAEIGVFENHTVFRETIPVIEDSHENYKFPALYYMVNSAFQDWINEKESEVQ